jgi:6-phosphogluconate dehydrogenase
MSKQQYEIGMVGLGVMGQNLVLNMADHGYSVAGYDKDTSKADALNKAAGERPILGAKKLAEFIDSLSAPRAVMMLVPAGHPVDAVIGDLLPHLARGDLIIDGGNSHFTETNRRGKNLADQGLQYLGVGISGGEHGARYGPSMMPGGPKEAYERVRPIFESVAAHVNGDPCVTYLGPGSAGHYVKMVHNGIEYGLMQLISETYDLLKRGLGLTNDDLHDVYAEWNKGKLTGYLMEITANIFLRVDDKTGNRLVDEIRDEARQKGTGMWASQDALELQVPVPTIDMAVAMRNMSALKAERVAASQVLKGPAPTPPEDRETFMEHLREALYAGMIITYAQGMAQLRAASEAYDYGLNLEGVARIWRGGCIIRAKLLEDMRAAYHAQAGLPNLLMDPHLREEILSRQEDLRHVVRYGAEVGIPTPALMTTLAYFDAYRSARLPANLIQAQRDYFGAHTYERVDSEGVFHTQWQQD